MTFDEQRTQKTMMFPVHVLSLAAVKDVYFPFHQGFVPFAFACSPVVPFKSCTNPQ